MPGQVRSFGICGEQSGTGAGFFPEYFGFPYQFSFHRLLLTHNHHPELVPGTIGQTVADVPSGLTFPTSYKFSQKSLQR
jgi:hypothetical protein